MKCKCCGGPGACRTLLYPSRYRSFEDFLCQACAWWAYRPTLGVTFFSGDP